MYIYACNNIFYKLFKSNDANVIGQCQYFCYIWPFYALYDYLRFSFLLSLFKKNLISENNPVNRIDFNDMIQIASKYNFNFTDTPFKLKDKIWKFIEQSILAD